MPTIPQPHRGNPLIDAETTLVGVIAHGALRPAPKRFVSGEVVRLNTKLDAAVRFTLVASHSSHTHAITVDLQLAPLLIDGATGSFLSAVKVSLPAEGGRWRPTSAAVTSPSPPLIRRGCSGPASVSPRRW